MIWAGDHIDNNRLLWSTADLVVACYVKKNLNEITHYCCRILRFYTL